VLVKGPKGKGRVYEATVIFHHSGLVRIEWQATTEDGVRPFSSICLYNLDPHSGMPVWTGSVSFRMVGSHLEVKVPDYNDRELPHDTLRMILERAP
jgi:hypothetical protein